MQWTMRRLAVLIFLIGLVACTAKPDAPAFDNPYDPNGTGPDPYALTATVSADSVRLQWIDNSQIASWVVFHSTVSATENFNAIDPITIDRNTATGVVTAGHHDFAPSVTNWYRLQANMTNGEIRSISLGAPAIVTPPPLVRLAGGGNTTSTRFLTLEVRNDLGEIVELSTSSDFSNPVSVSTQPGILQSVAFTLDPVTEVPATAFVHARNRVGGSVGVEDSTLLNLRFTPTFTILKGQRITSSGAAVVDTALVLGVSGNGVIRARVASSSAGLATALWDDSPDSIGWTL